MSLAVLVLIGVSISTGVDHKVCPNADRLKYPQPIPYHKGVL